MASPSFTFTGASGPLAKLSTTAAASVVATLDSLSGVTSVAWSIVGVDELSTAGSYTLTPSGTLGSVCTTTAPVAGRAAILKCTINGGLDPQTGEPSDSMSATAKFWVPATGTGLEVGCVGEGYESSSTYGWTGIINAAVRNVAAGGVTSVAGSAPIVSSGGATPTISISAATTVAAGSMSAADKLKLDNGGDFGTLTTDVLDAGASGDLSVGDTAGSTTITAVTDVTLDVAGDAFLYADGASSWWGYGGAGVLETDGSSIVIDTPTVEWTTGTTTPILRQAARTGDAATTSLTIASQAPYASATGANRDASPVIIQVPAPAAGGAVSYVRIDVDTTDNHRLMRNGVYIARHTTSGGAWIGAYTDLASSGSAAIYLGTGASTRGANDFVVSAGSTDASFNAPSSAGTWTARLGGTSHFYISASGGVTTYRLSDAAADVLTYSCDATGASSCTIGAGVTSYTLTQTTRASDAATYDIIIQTQPANASATTDANRQPGELILRVNRPSNGGTLAAGVTTQWGTATSDPTRREHAAVGVQTTDATVTTIGYLTLEEGSTHSMIVRVTGKVVATGVVLVEVWSVAAKRAGAGAVVENSQRLSTGGAGAWTITFDASGNDVRVRATGAGGTTIEWDCHIDTFFRVRS